MFSVVVDPNRKKEDREVHLRLVIKILIIEDRLQAGEVIEIDEEIGLDLDLGPGPGLDLGPGRDLDQRRLFLTRILIGVRRHHLFCKLIDLFEDFFFKIETSMIFL